MKQLFVKRGAVSFSRLSFIFLTLLLLLLSVRLTAGGDVYRSIKRLQLGSDISEVVKAIGEPDRITKVNRWVFPTLGHVVIIDEKVTDIRLPNGYQERSPIFRRKALEDNNVNKLRLVRIGNHQSEVLNLAGNPSEILVGEDWYYESYKHLVEITDGKVTGTQTNLVSGLEKLDWVRLNFSPNALLIMNITLAFIMFGVALQIRFDNFKKVLKYPKSLALGVVSQFLALPALTFVLVYFLQPSPSVALGMILVASCPGGNISNFMTSLAKGNVALSISLTAIATVSAVFITPFNFAFWGNLYSDTAGLVMPITIDFFEILRTVVILLGIPVFLGIWFARTFPALTSKIVKPLKTISMLVFIAFIVMAFMSNFDFFISYIHLIVLVVFLHNALALLTGFLFGTFGRTSSADRRTITIETGIQNSGLGLVLIFNPRLFDGLGGMAFIAAWWGIWHIISGLLIAYFWSKRPLKQETSTQPSQEA